MILLSDYYAFRRDQAKVYGVRPLFDVVDEPISLTLAQKHCQVDLYGSPPASDHDYWLETVGIPGARAGCEGWLEASIAQQSYEIATKNFPSGVIKLPFGPVQSITSIVYIDSDGVEQTMDPADYVLDPFVRQETVVLAYGATWPATRSVANSVVVTYVAGYMEPLASPVPVLPPNLMVAMLLMLSHLLANREATTTASNIAAIPLGVEFYLEPFRRRLSMA